MSHNVEDMAAVSNAVLAVAPGDRPISPLGVTVFFSVFGAMAACMATAYVERRT